MMLPLLASGHGMELMQARLQFDAAGAAQMEITADYGGNPMLNSEQEARTALQDILRIEVGGREHKLRDLAPLRLERRDQFDPSSPLPQAEPPGTRHQLITALWQWQPSADQFRFTVPEGCIHDVLFWKQEPGAKPQWRVLITGDYTPPIITPHPSRFPLLIGLAVLSVLIPAALLRLRPKSPCLPPHSTPSSALP